MSFLHGMVGCMRANASYELLGEEKVDFSRFSGYGRWLGKSPEMNPAQSVGAILQEKDHHGGPENMNNDATYIQNLAALVSESFGPCIGRWR